MLKLIWNLLLISIHAQGIVKVKMRENSPRGTEVTRLRKAIDATTPSSAQLDFRIMKQDRQNGLEIFEVEGPDGILQVKQSPDREVLCPGREECLIQLQVRLPYMYIIFNSFLIAR